MRSADVVSIYPFCQPFEAKRHSGRPREKQRATAESHQPNEEQLLRRMPRTDQANPGDPDKRSRQEHAERWHSRGIRIKRRHQPISSERGDHPEQHQVQDEPSNRDAQRGRYEATTQERRGQDGPEDPPDRAGLWHSPVQAMQQVRPLREIKRQVIDPVQTRRTGLRSLQSERRPNESQMFELQGQPSSLRREVP